MKDRENQEFNFECLRNHKEISDLTNLLYGKQDEFNLNNPYEVGYVIINILGYRKIPEDSVVLTRAGVSDKWIDLLTEFDEMGFEPTTLPPKDMTVEEYTAFYKEKLLMCFANASKETAEKILKEVAQIKVGYNANAQIIAFKVTEKLEELAKQFGVEIKE